MIVRSSPVSSGLLNSSLSRFNVSTNAPAAFLFVLTTAFIAASVPCAAAQAIKTASTPPPEASRFDLYGGYGYLHPVNSDIFHVQYQPINPGAVASATGYFNRYLSVSRLKAASFPLAPTTASSPRRQALSFVIRRTASFHSFMLSGAEPKSAAQSFNPAPGVGASPLASASITSFPPSVTASLSGPFRPTFITPTSTMVP
jgi:hypothetical protein